MVNEIQNQSMTFCGLCHLCTSHPSVELQCATHQSLTKIYLFRKNQINNKALDLQPYHQNEPSSFRSKDMSLFVLTSRYRKQLVAAGDLQTSDFPSSERTLATQLESMPS